MVHYVLLVTGTMNPPHRGHVRLGLHTARRLEAEGHSVSAICFVPAHNNYVRNKVSLARLKAGTETGEAEAFSVSARCTALRALVKAEGDAAARCHVCDYETAHAEELLAESEGYWEPKLGKPYLRTAPTASLVKHFVENAPQMTEPVCAPRLGVVLGVDNLVGMSSWNEPASVLARSDLACVARETPIVELPSAAETFLDAVATVEVRTTACEVRTWVVFNVTDGSTYQEPRSLFGGVHGEGSFLGDAHAQGLKAAEKGATLYLLPPLDGGDERLSSTKVREALAECRAALKDFSDDEVAAAVGEAVRRRGAASGGDGAALPDGAALSARVAEALDEVPIACLAAHGYESCESLLRLLRAAAESDETLRRIDEQAAARNEVVLVGEAPAAEAAAGTSEATS